VIYHFDSEIKEATGRVPTLLELWGGGFFVVSEPLRFAIGFSEPWQAFARAVMG
jgi:hypothetical protein